MNSAASPDYAAAPLRNVRLWSPDRAITRADGGVLYVRPVAELGPYPARLTDRLDHWAKHAPDRVYMAQRDASGAWRKLTYAQARDGARKIAQALLDRNLSVDQPVAIL